MKCIAHILKDNSEEILLSWEKRVRETIRASSKSSKITLQDHVPSILDDLIGILEEYENLDDPFEDERYTRIVDNSLEHGRHRAATQAYTTDEIVNEYIIFHRVITDLLNDSEITEAAPFNLIKYIIETAILKSIQSFSDALQEMQQKLVATLAHDIRNPLAAARMAIEMINPESSTERILKVKKMSYDSVNNAIKMLEGLLESVTVKAGEGMMLDFKEINLLRDIQEVREEASLVYDDKIVLDTISDSINGVFDGVAIRRLLENLITNAIKYGQSGEPITITATETEDSVQLKVHNSGVPIPAAKQAQIFKFLNHGETENSSRLKSWGIGLTLVKMVADAHEGSVELRSEEDFGTEFKVTLKKNSNRDGKVRTKLNFEISGI
ncbi:MAG: sensor histidine kinase [Leeuwenhoekiella sp.]